ncbi:MAG TPA: hypothetical protein VGN22_03235 [Pseudonocardia sp.]
MTTLVGRDGVLGRLDDIRCPALVLHGTADARGARRGARGSDSGRRAARRGRGRGASPERDPRGGRHPHLQRFLAPHA